MFFDVTPQECALINTEENLDGVFSVKCELQSVCGWKCLIYSGA